MIARYPQTIWLLLCWVTLVYAGTAAAVPPTPFVARYELLLNRLPVGEQQLTLKQQTDHQFVFETRLTPNRLARLFRNSIREEHSEFLWQNGIISQHYQLDRQDQQKERHAELTFDWSQQQVINDVAGERWQMPIPEGTLDKLNVQIAVMQDLAAGKKKVDYQIADGGKLKQYRFEVIDEQTIRAAGRTFHTLKLKRIRDDQDRDTYLWCAPELDYLPVQIQQTEREDNHTYLSRLTRHDFLPRPPIKPEPENN